MSEVGLSDSTLRIERSGPNEQHWSIIDLPGLIQGDKYVNFQSEELSPPRQKESRSSTSHLREPITPARTPSPSFQKRDVLIAEQIVSSYLKNERSIVL